MSGQTKKHSVIESVTNIVVGFFVAVIAQIVIFPWFGMHIDLGNSCLMAVPFSAISIARSYCLRRIFNRITVKSPKSFTVSATNFIVPSEWDEPINPPAE